MKRQRIFFLLFLIPSLLFGLNQKECTDIRTKITSEWTRHNELIEQFKIAGSNAEKLRLLQASLACCQRALSKVDTILNDIAGKSKKKRKEPWRVSMKEVCEQDQKNLNTEISELEKGINNIRSSIVFEEAKTLYDESLEKTHLAYTKMQECPRTLSNVNSVVSALGESAKLYREAKSLAEKAYTILTSAPSCDGTSKAILLQTIENAKQAAISAEKEAKDWPEKVLAQKAALKEQLEILTEDSELFEERGLKRSRYQRQKQALPILETLGENSEGEEKEGFQKRLEELNTSIALFEEEADQNRLTETTLPLSPKEFQARERERQEAFFKGDSSSTPQVFLKSLFENQSRPFAVPLDGLADKKGEGFPLYLHQFYRFLVQSNSPASSLRVQVSRDGELIHEEFIPLPIKNTLSWQRYLRKDGMIFIPETKLKMDFGVDLRLKFVCDPKSPFSMIIAQKGTKPGLQLSFSLDQEDPLFCCHFSLPPPWQLSSLQKPALPNTYTPAKQLIEDFLSCHIHTVQTKPTPIESVSFPILDTLALELKNDPLLIAQYVYQEIAFADPYLKQENGVFQAPGIHRNPLMTYLERRGSPWEQCQLLVYLLRKAGYQASYVMGDPLSIPRDFTERMLFTKLPEAQEEALVKYPWVIFVNGQEAISLFPWMKEIQITEGYDLYNLMPEDYASADRWIFRYLKGDENILKHVASDGNDTAALLFSRFVNEELRKQGLSLADVGIRRAQLKRQFSSWEDFPRPRAAGNHQIFDFIGSIPNIEAFVMIDISSHENPQKHLSCTLPLNYFTCSTVPIQFTPTGEDQHRLLVQFIGEDKERSLDLNSQDQLIDIKISYSVPVGSDGFHGIQTLSMAKGTSAALCFHLGGATPHKTSQFHQQFSSEKDEKKKIHALLSFVGAAYFEKCGHGEELLAELHKISPRTIFAFGLAKLSPDLSKGSFKDQNDLCLPQVDMFYFRSQLPSHPLPVVWNQEAHSAYMQWEALTTVDSSSNEHQILREVFSDPYAISTVKLLQLAHLNHEKEGGEGVGFIVLTPESFEASDKTPEVAKSLYFSDLKGLDLLSVKKASPGQWDAIKSLLDKKDPLSSWSYAYLTPGLISSQDGNYNEMGALILYPYTQYALISNNNLLFHGGLGSPLPSYYLTQSSIKSWELTPTYNGSFNQYSLETSSLSYQTNAPVSEPQITRQASDIRSWNKSWMTSVADPVDTITGAFYVDELDLELPGHFPLEIRRNYNSQNPVHGNLGAGWKLSLNPFLVKQDGKLFAAEADGSVICYSYNSLNSRYEVDPDDNPDLYNFNQKGIGGNTSLFHSYIQNNVLYGADGSKRFFEEGLLKKWVNHKGIILTFHYDDENLSHIDSSNGDSLGFHYNHQGYISEIYAKDGRRISYDYNSQGDLVKVTLPNTASITYEYDRHHRIIRETKPHGQILENIYDNEGRVKEQRSPVGPDQVMVTTATFAYAEGVTTVVDGMQGKTTYKIYDKQIYKVIDPLGSVIFQSWFVTEDSWFNAETEQVLPWEEPGAFPKSLKSTTDKRGLTTNYLYDQRGNPIQIELKGEDLTGDGHTRVFKKLAYNENNLCTEETTCGQTVRTIYDDNFPYQPKRIEKYHKKNLISYIDFDYNTQGLVTREDRNGSITLWHYNSRNLPNKKIQKTETEDPDYVATYSYNYQGRCIKIESSDAIEENAYDIMGNLIQSEVFSPSGKLLSATYIGYNQNNQPIWKQTANPDNTLHLDYNSSGLLKASWQTLTPSNKKAYRLYEYDLRGFLTQEIDPLGICTIRDYDALGNISCETIEGHSTQYTYEAGGLVETITSPSGAITTRHYTTNGLLKKEIYPDGTKTTIVYDFFGRPIQETKNGITWEMTYDDSNHQMKRTHVETGISETKEFDANGHLIRLIDGCGYAIEKTYDGLGRIKTETMPSGKQTTWNYKCDITTCNLPNGEQVIDRYEGGKVAESKTFDSCGNLIATSSYTYDPENDIQIITQGEVMTTTWMNTFGLPIKVQKGNCKTSYEYDKCGNCTAIIDGEGRTTRQTFDRLHRMTQKELPDGSFLTFDYDLDSNLIEYHLPNGNVWEASYDSMKRKTSEKIQAGRETTQEWNYSYEEGYLKEIIDPMGRSRRCIYDSYGRLAQETIDRWERAYTYDPRGLLLSAEQIGSQSLSWISSWFYTPREEHSIVERSYDADGHLTYESIYLNSKQIQETYQEWGPSYRTLQVEDHKRTLVYQNNQLTQVSTQGLDLAYTYHLSGALKDKLTPLYSSRATYNPSGLPETIISGGLQESLDWTPSGKLSTYHCPSKQKHFTYTPRGHIKSAGEERYAFDFEKGGTGVRTAAPQTQVTKLDPFGKVTLETIGKDRLTTDYNPMGQVTSQGGKTFEWDPWGRLLAVSNETFTWEASYDALGRRLQTRYTTQGSETLKATSLYDPQEEFQEIGIQIGNKTFWKLYGPSSCDAILDETGASAFLLHNALSELVAVITQQNTHYTPNVCSAYGPQLPPHISYDLLSYAQSLTWQSKSQDPTGLIWMGERYYDPRGGRFLSPDPIRHPLCMDLYTYASGDPINYFDPDGRFASSIYQTTKPALINFVNPSSFIDQIAPVANRLPSFLANHRFGNSHPFQVGLYDLPNGAIGIINGINNTKAESMEKAYQLSQYGQQAKVYGIYNATNLSGPIGKMLTGSMNKIFGVGADIAECGLGHIGFHTTPVQLLKNQWNYFIFTHGPKAKFFQNCHSGGADHVKNALLTSPESVRQRIIVLAINPSVIIPEELCYESYNYMSRRDFVTRLDIVGNVKHRNQLHILEPHPDAKFWDHDFLSPTFADTIERHVKKYIENYGGVQ